MDVVLRPMKQLEVALGQRTMVVEMMNVSELLNVVLQRIQVEVSVWSYYL